MKKVILFILLAGFLTNATAQKQSYAVRKATENASFVAEKMDLNKDKEAFLHDALFEKYEYTSKEVKAKGSDISKEEKKAIYGASYKSFSKKLSEEFSKDEVKEIFASLKEKGQQNKKK